MSRIYKVVTPTGNRLVDANTKAQAIGHCVGTDYSAEPISSSELYAAIEAGAKVEKVEVAPAKEKKSSSSSANPAGTSQPSAPNTSGSQTPLPQPAQSSDLANSSTQVSSASLPQPTHATTSASNAAPALSGQSGAAPAPAAGWSAPTSASAPANPILAEQQQINPRAVAAATPIIPIARPATPPAAPGATEGWTPREQN